MTAEIIQGDCREAMRGIAADSIDAIVSDPPYGLSFMGKGWDKGVPGVEFWAEALRVVKPGSYLLAFGGTRTFHRLTVAIEDAGFEIHDCLSWLYGSGFPKHKSKLKPAWEPIIVARKAAPKATPLNIDACRLTPLTDAEVARSGKSGGIFGDPRSAGVDWKRNGRSGEASAERRYTEQGGTDFAPLPGERGGDARGRWPANVVLDEEAAAALDEQSGTTQSSDRPRKRQVMTSRGVPGGAFGNPDKIDYGHDGHTFGFSDSGGASRFFYCAKASRSEREAGLEGFEQRVGGGLTATAHGQLRDLRLGDDYQRPIPKSANHHPTVKPVALMRWLVRLVTPPNGLVLDPFAGSGTTGVACVHEGRRFIGCELSDEYAAIGRARIAHAARTTQPSLEVA